MKRSYTRPSILSEHSFETSALSCGKTTDPPVGSVHISSAYDTFTGHFGSGFGGSESNSGSAGVGSGPGMSSAWWAWSGMCLTYVTYQS